MIILNDTFWSLKMIKPSLNVKKIGHEFLFQFFSEILKKRWFPFSRVSACIHVSVSLLFLILRVRGLQGIHDSQWSLLFPFSKWDAFFIERSDHFYCFNGKSYESGDQTREKARKCRGIFLVGHTYSYHSGGRGYLWQWKPTVHELSVLYWLAFSLFYFYFLNFTIWFCLIGWWGNTRIASVNHWSILIWWSGLNQRSTHCLTI